MYSLYINHNEVFIYVYMYVYDMQEIDQDSIIVFCQWLTSPDW